jgi:plasminogen activator inhibitor 1 RNA-binding protein
MSKNFFAALGDSDDEAPVVTKKVEEKNSSSAKPTGSGADAPAKRDSRPRNDDRNTKRGRGRPPARDGKRSYDRRSGTGRGKEIKKGGGGPRNWGSDKNDARTAEGTLQEGEEVPADAAPVAEGANNEGNEEVVKEEVVVEEEEDKTMTLTEYLSSKENPDSELFRPKAAKELDDEFAGMTMRKDVEEDFLVMKGAKAPRKKGNKKDEEAAKVDVGFRIKSTTEDNRRRDDRGGRREGGRGGDRGPRRGGRGGRGGRGRGVDALDPNAFPSL